MASEGLPSMRLDRLLVYLRIARTRSRASAMIEEGHMRLNGAHVQRSGHDVQGFIDDDINRYRFIQRLEILDGRVLRYRTLVEADGQEIIVDYLGQKCLLVKANN